MTYEMKLLLHAFSFAYTQGVELRQVQDELQRQHALVDQAARSVGLPSRQVLEELYELRQQVWC